MIWPNNRLIPHTFGWGPLRNSGSTTGCVELSVYIFMCKQLCDHGYYYFISSATPADNLDCLFFMYKQLGDRRLTALSLPQQHRHDEGTSQVQEISAWEGWVSLLFGKKWGFGYHHYSVRNGGGGLQMPYIRGLGITSVQYKMRDGYHFCLVRNERWVSLLFSKKWGMGITSVW